MRHAKKTLMALLFFLVALLAGNLAFAAPSASKDALSRKVIAFYCFDGTGKVTPSLRNLWQRQVRQAYPRVSYTFLDDPTILQKGRAGLLSLIQAAMSSRQVISNGSLLQRKRMSWLSWLSIRWNLTMLRPCSPFGKMALKPM